MDGGAVVMIARLNCLNWQPEHTEWIGKRTRLMDIQTPDQQVSNVLSLGDGSCFLERLTLLCKACTL